MLNVSLLEPVLQKYDLIICFCQLHIMTLRFKLAV